MKNRVYSTLAAMLLILVLAAACSSGGGAGNGGNAGNDSGTNGTAAVDAAGNTGADTADKPAVPSGEKVTLKFSYWGDKNETALKQRMIKDFEASHPQIKIDGTFTDGGTYPTKLQTFFSSNTAPDVISIAGDIMSDFVDKDVFEDLTPYMEMDDMLSGTWSDNFLNVFKANNTIIAAPFVYKIPAVVYNKDLFDEAGLSYPTDDWTEEQMLDLAGKLTNTGKNKIWGLNLSWFPSTLVRNLYGTPLYNAENNEVHAADNEQFKHAFTFLTDLVTKYKVAPDDAAAKAAGGGFETGKFAMSLTAPWEMQSFQKLIGSKFKWDIVRLPSSQYGPWKAMLFADGIGMSPKSKHKEAAWEFIKYMTADEQAQTTVAELGIPSSLQIIKSEQYLTNFPEGWTPYNKKAFVDMLDAAVPWYSTGVYAKVNDELGKQYQTVIQGKTTVDEAAAYLQEKGTELLGSGK